MREILLLLLFFVSLFAFKQDPDLLSAKLENGLSYYIKQNAKPAKTAHFYLVIDAGSIDEAPNERGLAHFVEHMAFNGSRDFDKNELIKKLESLGVRFGADLNAHTSYDETAYTLEISVNDENLKSAFQVFSNWIDGIKFDPTELEKERGVIIEEERQRNTPRYRLFLQQAKNLYKDSIYFDKFPIGDMNVVKNVDVATIKAFYDRVYQPRNMQFIAVGDFDVKKIEQLIKTHFRAAKNTNNYQIPDKTIPFQNGFNINIYDSKEIGQNSASLVFIDRYEARTNDAVARKILTDAYISSLILSFYDKRQNESTNPLQVSLTRPVIANQKVYYTFGANVLNNDFNASITEINSLIKGIKEHGFSKDDFEIARQNFISLTKTRYKNAKNQKSQNILNAITSSLSNGSTILSEKDSFELNMKLLNEISLDEVMNRFNEITSLNSSELNILATQDFSLLNDEYKSLVLTAKPHNLNTLGKILPKSLATKELKIQKIATKEHNKNGDFWILEFKNGTKVVLKELKTHKNKIELWGISRGGTSNLAQPHKSMYAVQVSNESGAGEFNNYELAKILSGKNISYEKRISELTQGYYGSSSTSDFESLLQAIWLEFNTPRLDENILNQIKTKAIDSLKKSKELPEYKFHTEFIKFLYNDNPRTKEPNENEINSLNLHELKKIIDDKFTNASSFIFFVVGDFEIKKLEPLLQKYIANLPSNGKKENFIDDGVRSRGGVLEFKKELQTMDRSDVSIMFKDKNITYSRLESLKARALNSVLSALLRENIREEKGQTYGFATNIRLDKFPYKNSLANISFSTDPKNLNDVINAIHESIFSLKEQGASKEHLQNFKKASLTQIPKNLENAEFWLVNLMRHFVFEGELFDRKWYENALKNITSDDIKTAVKKYLNDINIITTINGPSQAK
ncbi:insulinase family protein [Campylobacter sp. 1BO]|uniref:M16 family metallopeptidase n=1 Tax=Campylobacter sp. 1BO TaxID=3424760 RepID=UPI003D343750